MDATLSHLGATGYHADMPYLLAAFAVIVPVILVVQAIRGRVRLQCCSVAPMEDARIRNAVDEDARIRNAVDEDALQA
jgi:hypothetical protein